MLTVVKKYFKLIINYKKLNISAAMEYRVSFILQVALMMLNNASFIIIWGVLFSVNNNIGGYGFRDVMLLWAISSSSFGFSYVFFGKAAKIMNLIINGELDVYLLQPKNLLLNVIASETRISAIGDFLYGYILLAFLGADYKLWILFSVLVVIIGIMIAMFNVIINSLTFFLSNIKELVSNTEMFLITFSIYPEGIFNEVVKILLYTVIPAGFMAYIPVRILNEFDLSLFIALIGFTIVETIFALIIFNKGLKRYSSGNLMNMRS